MQIEERKKYIKLFDTYGKLLSVKQFDVMDKVLNFDLGESELAELENETRQSIHDAINKAKKQLIIFEEKCKIVENNTKIALKLVEIKRNLNKTQFEIIKSQIDEIIENL